ncbi:helix-turn-helix transcriptional regulator [Nocardioides sp. NPDC058538]|uniref:helix-turn-helix transcriptional regulator n=1 Tax=Nocardioides sp. NPDC058538 TaxID=3346542 RepID=UPI00364BD86F
MLIGREAEQRVVDQLFAGARIGRGGALAVTGEPGVGKTALIDDALDRLEGVQVLRAIGTEAEKDLAFAGLHLLLRPALHLLGALPEPQETALSSALALRAGTAGDRFAIGAATLSLLCRYAEQSPIAVVVDDLQWLDRPSAEALAFAARRIDADPAVVLLAGRSGVCDDLVGGLDVLELPGLDAAAAGDLVRAQGVAPPTDEHVARLFAATGGNPLALLELGRNIDLLDDRAPGLPPALPATLTAAFSRRLAELDPGTRTALLAAVVANGDLHHTGEVCKRLGLDVSGLGPAERAGLVVVTGSRIDVRHPLVRAAVYTEADESLRRIVHLAVADLLPDDAERRAWHLAEATWGPDPEVARLLEAAADSASARTAYTVASTAYERAARLSTDTDRWHVLLCAAAEAAWTGGLHDRAVALLDEIETRPVPQSTRSRTLRIRAQIAARSGSVADAVRILERAAPDAPTPDDTVLLLAEALHAAYYLADATVSTRLATSLLETVAVAESPWAHAIGITAAGMAKVLSGDGGFEELQVAVPLLAAHADPVEHPEALPWLLTAPLFFRDARTGADLRRIVDDVRSRMGVGQLPNVLFHVARDQATSTSWSRAAANYEEAIRLARETGQGTDLAMSLAGLAWLESRRGRSDACREHASEAVRLCTDRGIRMGEAWCLYAVGDLELAEGDPRAAAKTFLDLSRRLDEWGIADPDLSPGAELVDALLRLGRPADAEAVARRYSAAARAKGRPWSSARAHRAEGTVADDQSFDAHFEAAIEGHADTRDLFEAARTHLAYGGRLRRAGRRVDARAHLRTALESFDDLGADPWARTTAAELEATGEKVARREASGAASLTPQELQVSLLLAEGRTTRETAAALFLSPKTVEYHLRKVYTKLDIHSRAELAAQLLDS